MQFKKEVVEEKTLVDKFKDYRPLMARNFAEDLAHIAMLHAVEIAIKAKSEYLKENPRGIFADDWIIKKLKKESELNKTKEG